jgi:GT2 family glycosyltransferase
MDSDDIMVHDRIQTQIDYMENNPSVMICGGQVNCFNSKGETVSSTNHKSLTLEDFKKTPSHWFLNHPTVCFRKSAIMEVGNYNTKIINMIEDFDLGLRFLKKYGYIHNMSEVLLKYRLHDEQVTHQGGKEGRPYWSNLRNELIQNIIFNDNNSL